MRAIEEIAANTKAQRWPAIKGELHLLMSRMIQYPYGFLFDLFQFRPAGTVCSDFAAFLGYLDGYPVTCDAYLARQLGFPESDATLSDGYGRLGSIETASSDAICTMVPWLLLLDCKFVDNAYRFSNDLASEICLSGGHHRHCTITLGCNRSCSYFFQSLDRRYDDCQSFGVCSQGERAHALTCLQHDLDLAGGFTGGIQAVG